MLVPVFEALKYWMKKTVKITQKAVNELNGSLVIQSNQERFPMQSTIIMSIWPEDERDRKR